MNVVYSGQSTPCHDGQLAKNAVQETDDLAELASRIEAQGLETLAVIALEMLKPIGFLSSQLLLVLDPLLSPLVGEKAHRWAALMEDRANIERLSSILRR